jgi:hypothetical protein
MRAYSVDLRISIPVSASSEDSVPFHANQLRSSDKQTLRGANESVPKLRVFLYYYQGQRRSFVDMLCRLGQLGNFLLTV